MSRTLIDKFSAHGLELTVSARLREMNDAAVLPFWETLKKTGLTGKFDLQIIRKDVGVSIGYPATKIGASDNTIYTLSVKFQNDPNSCYDGILIAKGIPGTPQVSTAIIRDKLIAVAGIGWFNPQFPSTRKPAPTEAKPLLKFSEVIDPTLTATGDGSGASTHLVKPSGFGISRRAEEMGLLLQELAAISDGGFIPSDIIADTLVAYVHGATAKAATRRGYGSIITVWVRMGYLEAVSDAPKARLYKITEKAVKECGLILPPPKEIDVLQAAGMQYDELVKVLGFEKLDVLIATAHKNADELQDARAKTNRLTRAKKNIASQIKALKTTTTNPKLIASVKLLEIIPKLK